MLTIPVLTVSCSHAPPTSAPAAVAYPKFTAKDYLSRDSAHRKDWVSYLADNKLSPEPAELARALLGEPVPGFASALSDLLGTQGTAARDRAVLKEKARFALTASLRALSLDSLGHFKTPEARAYVRRLADDPDRDVRNAARRKLGMALDIPAGGGPPGGLDEHKPPALIGWTPNARPRMFKPRTGVLYRFMVLTEDALRGGGTVIWSTRFKIYTRPKLTKHPKSPLVEHRAENGKAPV